LFIERAIWIHFKAYVKISSELPFKEIKCNWLQSEGHLISFKNEILPYLSTLQKSEKASMIDIFEIVEQRAF
jgi:hypothetical protein